MVNFFKIYLQYFYLIVFAFLFECFFNKITSESIFNFLENMLFALALISLIYIFRLEKLKKMYFIISYLFFSLCIYFETVYYHLFSAYLSSSSIFIALESNTNESKEFISFYLTSSIIVFTVLLNVLIIFSLLKVKRSKQVIFLHSKVKKVRIIILFISIILFLKISTLIIYNLPYLVLKSGVEYYAESRKLNDYKINRNGNFNNVSRIDDSGDPETYIIIIGESVSKSHMSIYGYYRETTPLLDEINNELLIYKNVISPHTYTIASLSKSLTLGNYEKPEDRFRGTIIQLLNQANFKTYWISNQRPIGVFDSQVTKMGMGANNTYFLNTRHTNEKTNFDEVLLKKLNKVFLDDGNKKVIFLHMIGAHINYKNRYPESFNYFQNEFDTRFDDKQVYKVINSYDNAVRYSDYIIRKVIESTKKLNQRSCVLYFSDHGEEVYNQIYFSGHSADQVITKNIYEIPLILWVSEKYNQKKSIPNNFNSKYLTDDLFHSIADLVDVKSNEVDSSRSIFNAHFKERKRIIRDTIDYDTFFK